MIVVGVDPGGAYCGLVARRGDELLAAKVLDREKLVPPIVDSDPITRRRAWLGLVVVAVDDMLAEFATIELGVENVTKPHPYGGRANGQARVIDPGPILDTAVVLGAVLGCWPSAHIVNPHHNGDSPDFAYPEGIRSGRRGLGGPSKHARSAWDVAGKTQFLARLASRGGEA